MKLHSNILFSRGSALRGRVLSAGLLLSLSGSLLPSDVSAQVETPDPKEASAPSEGYVCVGYHPHFKVWGHPYTESGDWIECPPHYAFFGIKKPQSGYKEAGILILGSCCRLPAEDILTDDHRIVDMQCPEGSIVTGSAHRPCLPDAPEPCRRPLRCTRINSKKYSLGPTHPGTFWGISSSSAFPWKEKKHIRRNQIPIAIRYGISRTSRTSFWPNGCVGDPIGSLLVGKGRSRCSGTFWRQLLYRSTRGESAERTPVKMFPECQKITGVFSEEATCLR